MSYSDLISIVALGLQLFGIAIAARYVVKQVKLTKAEDIKLKLYDDFSAAYRAACDALHDASWCPKRFEMELFSYANSIKSGVNCNLPGARVKEFTDANWKASDAAIKIITLIEGCQCVEPRFNLFQKAISVALADIRDSYMLLHSAFIKTLPIDVANESDVKVIQTSPMDDAVIAFLKPKIEAYYDNCGVLSCWLADLNVELQNVFMQPLFRKKAKHRQPKDPKYRVMSFDNYDACNSFLDNETKWGDEKKKYESM